MSDKEVLTVPLEGFGPLAGKEATANFVKRLPGGNVVLEIEGAGGKKVQFKFSSADGMPTNADPAKGGYKISDQGLITLKAPKIAGKGGPHTATNTVASEKPSANPEQLCFCGCGGATSKGARFIPSHDAKAHSVGLKLLRGQLPEEMMETVHPIGVKQWVIDRGGWNSQPRAASNRTASVDPSTVPDELKDVNGKPLAGQALKARMNKLAKEKEDQEILASAANNGHSHAVSDSDAGAAQEAVAA